MKNVTMLFSPGIDSFIGYWQLKKLYHDATDVNIKKIYIDINSKYSSFEIKFLKDWYDDIVFVRGPDMSSLEQENSYIPNRNSVLVSLAQSHTNADAVYINSMFDDRVSDGSVSFRFHMSEALSISAEKPIIVSSVVQNLEKCVYIRNYSKENPDKAIELLTKTYSCYCSDLYEIKELPYYSMDINTGDYYLKGKITNYGCLSCSACYRKMCSLVAADIFIPFYDYSLIESYMLKDIDSNKYPNRVWTMKKYLEFNQWFSAQ